MDLKSNVRRSSPDTVARQAYEQEYVMNLTPEQRNQVADEVKRFAADLNLSSEQKERLQTAFQSAREKLGDYMKDHPGITRADIVKEVAGQRDQIRQRVENFLNPEQLKKWDTQVVKAKDFLGQHMA
jgi:hypothetical protein